MKDSDRERLLPQMVIVGNDGAPLLEFEAQSLPLSNQARSRNKHRKRKNKKKEEDDHETSNPGTILRLWKANVGSGVLAMPNALSNCGLVAGSIMIVVIGFLFSYCMQWLMSFSKMVRDRESEEKLALKNKKLTEKKKLIEERNYLKFALEKSRLRSRHTQTNVGADETPNGELPQNYKKLNTRIAKFAGDYEIGESSSCKRQEKNITTEVEINTNQVVNISNSADPEPINENVKKSSKSSKGKSTKRRKNKEESIKNNETKNNVVDISNNMTVSSTKQNYDGTSSEIEVVKTITQSSKENLVNLQPNKNKSKNESSEYPSIDSSNKSLTDEQAIKTETKIEEDRNPTIDSLKENLTNQQTETKAAPKPCFDSLNHNSKNPQPAEAESEIEATENSNIDSTNKSSNNQQPIKSMSEIEATENSSIESSKKNKGTKNSNINNSKESSTNQQPIKSESEIAGTKNSNINSSKESSKNQQPIKSESEFEEIENFSIEISKESSTNQQPIKSESEIEGTKNSKNSSLKESSINHQPIKSESDIEGNENCNIDSSKESSTSQQPINSETEIEAIENSSRDSSKGSSTNQQPIKSESEITVTKNSNIITSKENSKNHQPIKSVSELEKTENYSIENSKERSTNQQPIKSESEITVTKSSNINTSKENSKNQQPPIKSVSELEETENYSIEYSKERSTNQQPIKSESEIEANKNLNINSSKESLTNQQPIKCDSLSVESQSDQQESTVEFIQNSNKVNLDKVKVKNMFDKKQEKVDKHKIALRDLNASGLMKRSGKRSGFVRSSSCTALLEDTEYDINITEIKQSASCTALFEDTGVNINDVKMDLEKMESEDHEGEHLPTKKWKVHIKKLNEILSRNSDSSDSEDDHSLTIDYPDTVEKTFKLAYPSHQGVAKIFSFVSSFLLIFTHFCCCCVCFLFVAESLSEVGICSKYFGTHNSFALVGYAVPFIFSLSVMPERCNLTGVIVIADLLQLIGLGILIYQLARDAIHENRAEDIDLYIAPFTKWPMFFTVVFYSFEGAGVTLHLQNHMKNKDSLPGWKGVYNISMYLVIPLYVTIGALGYLRFGNDVAPSVTFSLPEGRLTDVIQIMTCLGILLTYPFHFSHTYTPIKEFAKQGFIWCGIPVKNIGTNWEYILDFFFRLVFVACTYLWSACFPDIELQISLAGAVSVCTLVLLIPSFMYLTTYKKFHAIKTGKCRLLAQIGIFILGLGSVVMGLVTAILHASDHHEHHHNNRTL